MTGLAHYSEELRAAPMRGGARAAVLLLALGQEGAARLLKHLAPDEIVSLRKAAAALDTVSPEQIDEVVEEFASTFKRGPLFPGPGQQMTDLLRGALSEGEYEALFPDETKRPGPGTALAEIRNVWEAVADIEAEELAARLAREHPHIVAIVVAKLPSERAALVARAFEPAFRNDVLRRMLQVRPLAGPVQGLFESYVRRTYLVDGDDGPEDGRHTALAGVVNRLGKEDGESLIGFIERDRPDEAKELRRLLFAFEDIPAMPQKARLTLFDGVATERVILALRGADEPVRESILSVQGARAKRMIEAELAQETNASGEDIETARRSIASLALEMAQNGQIVLREDDEE